MKTFTSILLSLCLYGSIESHAACQAMFTYSINGQTVTFTNTSTGTNQFTNYYWDFGDMNYGYNQNEVHAYQYGGTYQVCLTIYDSMQTCYSMFCDSFYVNGPQQPSCTAAFTYVVNGNTVTFTNTSTPPSTTTTYYWQFGQSNWGTTVGTSQGISFTFPNNGTYNVCLAFTDSTCSDSICQMVTVGSQSSCTASFTYTVVGNTVTFNNTSSSGQAGWYQWNFGDNSQYSYNFNPVHTYPGPGTYYVCVILTDSFCTDSFCQNVVIGSSGWNEYTQVNAVYYTHPNPFNGSTAISYTIFEDADVELAIFDIVGNQVTSLEKAKKQAGSYELNWNASEFAAGTYFLKLQVNGRSASVKLTLIK